MGLPWVRLDANVNTHDKFLALIVDPSPRRWQAISTYFFALGWSGGQGQDGRVPLYALAVVHGSQATADLLVKYELWDKDGTGWTIRNYDLRQELDVVSEAKRSAQSLGGKKARCRQNHGPGCGCWKDG